MTPRWIAHLDMDAFYASVELLRYPQLKGLPVVIGGRREHQPQPGPDGQLQFARLKDYTGRGVITTATYAARAFGVRSGLGLMKAAQLSPDCILLPVDFEAYRAASRRFKAAVREIAPVIEDRGIDEIYIDLTELAAQREGVAHDPLGGLKQLAQDIKNNVRGATQLTCSIGLAPNKLLAKIASELDKPDGLTLIRPEDLTVRIWPLSVRAINGVGPKAAERLESLGIHTIGALAACDPAWLIQRFGKAYGAWLHESAHGRDDRPVITHSESVSISHETTFERDLHAVRDKAELGRILTSLCEALAQDLAKKKLAARTIGIKLRFEGFKTVTRDQTLDAPVFEARAIRHAAGLCLKRVDLSLRLRLMGVRASGLQATPLQSVRSPLVKPRPRISIADLFDP
ncbi:DNA polymerase IV [Inhella gelatinilytica]|uniref:DNA polymerase IV n=1 Tax=Inhella gelatinilytica TaxID=2795030 RepID=A0A931IZJ2_9BURK|nr:DNA polymerase IV [Inhella gelatinilytica]MBH9553453.1 DNA polymerase IV [Inhella gelatinilytica]